MTEIDIFSGFLGAGKTTLLKKLIAEAFTGEKLVLIENEFGEVGVDSAFLRSADASGANLQVTEMNSGCICCSLAGDFTQSLQLVLDRFSPDRVLIEPSGVGKLSDVAAAVAAAVAAREQKDVRPGCRITVADAQRCKLYARNFGEFYRDQIHHADLVVLSRSQLLSPEKLEASLALLRGISPTVPIVTTPWDELSGRQIYEAARQGSRWAEQLLGRGHDGDEHDEDCHCEACAHERHDHDHGHHEHHDHGHHEHHHDGDEVFQSWGRESARLYDRAELETLLEALSDESRFGMVLRAKGVVPTAAGWLEFDYVPGEKQLRPGHPEVSGRVCVIGSGLREGALEALFGGRA